MPLKQLLKPICVNARMMKVLSKLTPVLVKTHLRRRSMALIKNNRIVADHWQSVGEDDPIPAHAPILVSLSVWQYRHNELLSRGAPLGVVLESDEAAESLEEDLPSL